MAYDENKNFPVSWEELHRNSKALAWRLLELGPFTGIVAVTRGGLVPAAIVARELEIRHIETACLASYHAQDRGEVEIIKAPDNAGDGTGWLIIDDLVDTGETGKCCAKSCQKVILRLSMPSLEAGLWWTLLLLRYLKIRGFSFRGT